MTELELGSLITELKSYLGITRKRSIADVVKAFPKLAEVGINETGDIGVEVIADFGEDAAVIALSDNPGDDGVLLLAADGIMSSLMDADPYWAGYCSVLVNLHDIAAMGGHPLAVVDVLSVKDESILGELTSGMNAASQKFGVPIVGGHIHPDTKYNAVDVAILGIGKRSAMIYSHSAQLGDDVIFAMDLDGCVHPNAKYAWDTTQDKAPEIVRRQLGIMAELASSANIHSGKDISNPGALGTLGMLLESSKKGAMVDLDKIPRPEDRNIELSHWLKMYQGCGFVVTCNPGNSKTIIDSFSSVGLTSQIAGRIIPEKKLKINAGNESGVLFDFNIDSITGI
jgi:putative methanogenesis marker protein 2